MKALCTEAALRALRRRYPQIYTTKDKLQLDVSSIDISAGDFHHAMTRIVPAACRMTASLGRPLSSIVKPLLSRQLKDLIALLSHTFPFTEAVQQSCELQLSLSLSPPLSPLPPVVPALSFLPTPSLLPVPNHVPDTLCYSDGAD